MKYFLFLTLLFFEKEGYQSHMNGLRETKRGTSDPTYLYYTLGKLEILKLREALQEEGGRRLFAGEISQSTAEAGFPTDQTAAADDAGRQ